MADGTVSTKQYLLDHVLYEMEMYLHTYHLLHAAIFPEKLDFNTVWNSHNVALRNLMSFFGISGQVGKDEIVYNSFSFAEQPSNRKKRQEFYSPISKAINHISIQRFLGYNGERLDDVVIRARETVFPEMLEYIRRYILHLETDAAIKYTYSLGNKECTVDITNELSDSRVAGMIAKVKQLDCLCSMHGSCLNKTVTTE